MLQLYATLYFITNIIGVVHNSNVTSEIVTFCSSNGFKFPTFVTHENEKFHTGIIKQMYMLDIHARILSYDSIKEFHNDQDILIFDGRTNTTQLSIILSEIRVRQLTMKL